MKEVPDHSGRFGMRPHFEPRELDRLCERVVREFFIPIYSHVPYPIPTDDLTKLLERDTSDFDPGADLPCYGTGVEGVTEFFVRKKPRVRIAAELAYDDRRQNRYRTTLTHEYAHVRLHSHLFELAARDRSAGLGNHVCMRDRIVTAPYKDWLEWQAGYACGAMLMPLSEVLKMARECAVTHDLPVSIGFEGAAQADIVSETVRHFEVSAQAARIRLKKLGIIVG